MASAVALADALASAPSSSPAMTSSIVAKGMPSQESWSWLGTFGWLIFHILNLATMILYQIIRVITITIPSFLFRFLSTSWTITMNATTLMFILAALVSAVSWVVRYRILNMYSRLPPEPQRKEPEIDLFPDTHEEDTKSGLASYLDEFLSAIKIFGYLERPVFHELTRSMQTRKLIAGETINLEDEKGFCIVVDGMVQIFVKSGAGSRAAGAHTFDASMDSSDDEDALPGHQKYQLLTEVRNGAPMSSLFSIMSLFTEDIKLHHGEEEAAMPPAGNNAYGQPGFSRHVSRGSAHNVPLTMPNTPQLDGAYGVSRLEEARARQINFSSESNSGIPPMSLDGPSTGPSSHRPTPQRLASSSAHPDIIGRATVDTTIAVIPASAFRRLIRIYPKATAHIVHVILSRFQRVTLSQAFNYLGLTSEVLQTERNMVKYTTCHLPNALRGDALTRLKEKFNQARENTDSDSESKGIALHNPASLQRRKVGGSRRRESMRHTGSREHRPSPLARGGSHNNRENSFPQTPGPGDLLADVQLHRNTTRLTSADITLTVPSPLKTPGLGHTNNPFNMQRPRLSIDPRENADEDSLFRTSVLECMLNALGLGRGGEAREPDSIEASPRLASFDQRRARAMFTSNAFGLMGPLDNPFEGDSGETESIASSGLPSTATPSAQSLAQELKDEMEIVFFRQGSVLTEQGERNPGLYYVIDGFLDIGSTRREGPQDIIQSNHHEPTGSGAADRDHDQDEFPNLTRTVTGRERIEPREKKRTANRRSIALVKPGGLAGYIGSVSSYRSFIDVVAKTDVYVGFLPRDILERIVDKYPIVLLTMAKRLTNILPRLILHIDFALEWVQVNAGQVIYHESDESEAIYIVLNGRLRLVEGKKDGGVLARAEFGQGESVGEIEVLTETARSGTLHAIRDTEMVKFPRTLFNSLAQEHPNITIKISKIIASRMRALIDESGTSGVDNLSVPSKQRESTMNIRTVAILPVTAGVPVVEFGSRLMSALAQVQPPNGATSLNQAAILKHLGKYAFNKMGKLRLSQYLADLEEKYGLVVYIADTNVNSPWTQTCIKQADSILLVGLADGSPAMGEYERFMLGMKSTARKSLVLLHAERFSSPGLTRSWLRNRMWINGGHFHIQMPLRTNTMPVHTPLKKLGSSLKETVQVLQAEIQKYTSRPVQSPSFFAPDTALKSDFHRLARRLCGKSVGLVLGGGGARGLSQIGIIKAMEEAGIPIDVIGGTSIGSFVGGLYAQHAAVLPMFGYAKKFSGRMSSLWRFALDLTYPSASYTTGHEFNRGIFKTFGNTQIEDFWLEYYCNTTNITKSRAEYHTSGYAWRYIRASMSLAGLLPPLCDEGSMLLDGGYQDNLTVSYMKGLGVDLIFAIDVGAVDDDAPQTYGDSLSGVWAFFNRWNPLTSHPNPPTLAEIQGRLAYVSSIDALERAKTTAGCIYMRPPVDEYATLDFHKFDELQEMGYKWGQEFLHKLRDQGVLPLVEETEAKQNLRRTMAPRRASV